MKGSSPVVLVSGGNRGIGFEACRALAQGGATVLLGARKFSDGERAARELSKAGTVVAVPLDVADAESVAALKTRVKKEFGVLDVLVNNAGVYADAGKGVLSVPEEVVEKTLSTNLLGAWRLCRAFAPEMADKRRGRIVNVSSGMGALSSMGADAPSYRVSKAALNALTLALAAELKPAGVSVVSSATVISSPGRPLLDRTIPVPEDSPYSASRTGAVGGGASTGS